MLKNFTQYLKDIDCIIFSGGSQVEIDSFNFLSEMINIICVDSGIDYAIKKNLRIDIAIGDFDSCSKDSFDYIIRNKIKNLNFPKDKDKTDMELSFDYCMDKNYENILVLGALGTRYDHSISNINMLKKYYQKGLKIILFDNYNFIKIVEKEEKIKKNNFNISFLPTDEKCIFSTSGLKWNLTNHLLEYGSSLTISNKVVGDFAHIKILEGSLILIISKD